MRKLPPAASFFLLKTCNLDCRFCFATFRDVDGQLTNDECERVVAELADAGLEKITFVGGEPTLHPHLSELVKLASEVGMTTCVVTNGARLPKVIRETKGFLDWVGLSVDSADEYIQSNLGRGLGKHVARSKRLAELCHDHGIRLKLNTVVTSMNWQEDMGDYARALNPDRWKAFQVLPVDGQNDGSVEDLLITEEQFQVWVNRHKAQGLTLVPETNDLITGSYVLVDPEGRFFTDTTGRHTYSKSIIDVGVDEAWKSMDFYQDAFEERGGLYDWTRSVNSDR